MTYVTSAICRKRSQRRISLPSQSVEDRFGAVPFKIPRHPSAPFRAGCAAPGHDRLRERIATTAPSCPWAFYAGRTHGQSHSRLTVNLPAIFSRIVLPVPKRFSTNCYGRLIRFRERFWRNGGCDVHHCDDGPPDLAFRCKRNQGDGEIHGKGKNND